MIDDWIPTDDDAPDAPPKTNGRSGLRLANASDFDLPDWVRGLATNAKGTPTKEPGNAATILSHSTPWKGVLRHDAQADVVRVDKLPSLPNLPSDWPALSPPEPGVLAEPHVIYAGLWLSRQWSQSWAPQVLRSAMVYAAKLATYDPLVDYLEQCAAKWDREPRVATWLADYLGAERSGVHLRIGTMWLVSAVARAVNPGEKVDYVLVLEGTQGAGKNRAMELLFGDRYFLPEVPDVRDKDAMHLLRGAWCACIDELSAIRAADVERVKSFLTRRIDVYRPPYERDVVTMPRRCVFVATTNAPEYLTDSTGNRRYWPVRCETIDHDAIVRDRDQIWGEAMVMHRNGVQHWPEELDHPALRIVQESRAQVDEWEDRVRKFVDSHEWTTAGDCLASLGKEPADWSPGDVHRVTRILTRLGWEPSRVKADGRPPRYWARKE